LRLQLMVLRVTLLVLRRRPLLPLLVLRQKLPILSLQPVAPRLQRRHHPQI
jgi:hypothetical protein